jgi:aspartate/methionine/tyrosine aminotransferase
MVSVIPDGGFFIMANTKHLSVPSTYYQSNITRDWALCRWLTCDVGVSPIPPSAFYSQENKDLAADFARFAFCKKEEDLDECAKRFALNLK